MVQVFEILPARWQCPVSLHIQCHGSWCPGSLPHQGKNIHGIYLVIQEISGFSTRTLLIHVYSLCPYKNLHQFHWPQGKLCGPRVYYHGLQWFNTNNSFQNSLNANKNLDYEHMNGISMFKWYLPFLNTTSLQNKIYGKLYNSKVKCWNTLSCQDKYMAPNSKKTQKT